MDILVLGGTGAMGEPLVELLSQTYDVFVTTRQNKQSKNKHITYIRGNAKDISFLSDLLKKKEWDAIVDFMVWGALFPSVSRLFLDSTKQYVFLSSARVYAQSEMAITEETPRLLEVSEDEEYLKTDEYALAKAREEDILLNSGKKNFTIVRPTITYNRNRLQLGSYEKEYWLYRAMHGRSIVFSEDIAEKRTTLTYGGDVAIGIASLIGESGSLGEVFHITCPTSLLWSDVLKIYLNVLENKLGKRPRVVMTKESLSLQFKSRYYQVVYSRYFNRTFDNSKISHFCNIDLFKDPATGLPECLEEFFKAPTFKPIDWKLEALNDKVAGEKTPLSEIPLWNNKIDYVGYRYNLRVVFLIRDTVLFFRNSINKILRLANKVIGL